MKRFVTEKEKPFNDWPTVGESLVDDSGRVLVVSEVRPGDRRGRNVIGEITGGGGYSCDILVLIAIWRRV